MYVPASQCEKLKTFIKLQISVEYSAIPDIIKRVLRKSFNQKLKRKKNFCQQELNDYCINKYRKLNIKGGNEGISQSVMDIFNVRYDLEDRAIVFEVRDNDGKTNFIKETNAYFWIYAKYNIHTRLEAQLFWVGALYTKQECIKAGEKLFSC